MSEEIDVALPKLGESIVSATVVKWLKTEGEAIAKDEPLVEVATDKVNSEIPSPVSGVVKEIKVEADEELQVGDVLAVISTQSAPCQLAPPERPPVSDTSPPTGEMRDSYSPAILRLAREHGIGIDALAIIPRTGAQGRLTKRDLESHIARRQAPSQAQPHQPVSAEKGDVEYIKMTGMRKAIADSTVRSFSHIPHATLIDEIDVTRAMGAVRDYRETLLKERGVKLTISAVIARALTRALLAYPLLNASLNGDTIVVKKYVNLGIAVSVDQGILIPVIEGCQERSLAEIAEAIQSYAQKAREGALHVDEMHRGTVTMTNFGMSGVRIGVPIIRHPEVAIIGVGSIVKRVVPLDGDHFGVRQMMHLSLTFDHRVVDGMYGCRFLGALKGYLEDDLEVDG